MSISLQPNNNLDLPENRSSSRPLFLLGRRLSVCAQMVRAGAHLADIGTDHAYLPVWLALRGDISSAVASDIRLGPLRRARQNILRYGVSGLVSERLSDGLAAVSPEEADDIVIAGMGGKMIARIMEGAPWLRNPEKHLILQPMTSVEDLRLFLAENGFAVLEERAAEEDGHIYSAMLVAYIPELCLQDELTPYIGKLKADTEESRAYLRRQVHRLSNRAEGLRLAGDPVASRESARLAVEIEHMLSKTKTE
jgi:tRNA (adenine22-N1)-methyltransferase